MVAIKIEMCFIFFLGGGQDQILINFGDMLCT